MNLKLTLIIKAILSLIILLLTSCDNKKKVLNQMPKLLTEDSYKPKTICDCNDDGIEILNKILDKREEFSKIDDLTQNKFANEYTAVLKKSWKAMQYKCLKTFGPKLLRPSDCNDPDQIQAIKDKLFKLGIMT